MGFKKEELCVSTKQGTSGEMFMHEATRKGGIHKYQSNAFPIHIGFVGVGAPESVIIQRKKVRYPRISKTLIRNIPIFYQVE
jgi:hypothetical protein